MNLGINLCFAVKRMPDPEAWAAFVRDDLGLGSVQLTFDLLDPWWSEPERGRVISRIRQAAERQDLSIHSACVGLAHYVPAGLLDPDPDAHHGAHLVAARHRRGRRTRHPRGRRATGQHERR